VQKNILYIFFLILTSFLFVTTAVAQSKMDSLISELDKSLEAENDSNSVNVLVELYEHTKHNDPFLPIQYAAQARTIFLKNNDSTGVALMHRYMADVYAERKIHYMAIQNYTTSFEIYHALENRFEIANSYLRIGDSYRVQLLDANASTSYEKAFEIYTELKSNEGIAYVLDRSALILAATSYDEAIEKLNQSLEIRQKLQNPELVAMSFENFANFYILSEEDEIAIEYLKKALIKYKLSENKLKTAHVYSKLGELFLIVEEYRKAEQSYEKALSIYGGTGIPYETAKAYAKIAHIGLQLKEYEKAEGYTEMALFQSSRSDFQDVRLDSYLLYAQIHSAKKNYEKASKFFKLHNSLSDSISSKAKSKHANETQILLVTASIEKDVTILEQEKKSRIAQIEKQKAESQYFKTIMYGLGAVTLVIIFFGYKVFRANKETKKANTLLIDKNEEINQQKEEIQAANDSLESANVEITAAKDDIESKSEKIASSLNYASRIQRAMLPKMKEVREELPDAFVMLSPRDAVSGDFFWYGVVEKENGEKKIVIAAVDCTGHGVPGAFMSMIGDSYLNQIVMQQQITSPEVILEELHNGVRRALQQDKTDNNDGMDMTVCVIDKESKTLEFAGAKNPLVYMQNGEMKLIKGNSFSIGGLMRARGRTGFTKHIIDISEETHFYIYSDGYQDQFGIADDGRVRKYMAKRFRQFLFETHKQPMNEQAVTFAVEFDEWRGERSQMDDVLLIGVKLDLTN